MALLGGCEGINGRVLLCELPWLIYYYYFEATELHTEVASSLACSRSFILLLLIRMIASRASCFVLKKENSNHHIHKHCFLSIPHFFFRTYFVLAESGGWFASIMSRFLFKKVLSLSQALLLSFAFCFTQRFSWHPFVCAVCHSKSRVLWMEIRRSPMGVYLTPYAHAFSTVTWRHLVLHVQKKNRTRRSLLLREL